MKWGKAILYYKQLKLSKIQLLKNNLLKIEKT